jgi:hypothetical protein
MRGNLHVRFLGEGVRVTGPPYPTFTIWPSGSEWVLGGAELVLELRGGRSSGAVG